MVGNIDVKLRALQQIKHSVGIINENDEFVTSDAEAAIMIAEGKAVDAKLRPAWKRLRWSGSTVVIIASGPSLTEEDCELVAQWRNGIDRRTIVINLSYQRALWADILYACDGRWWERYYKDVVGHFSGVLWTQDELAAKKFGISYVRSEDGRGLNRKIGVINQGLHSGYQSIGLAYQAGADKIILLGFDCTDNNILGGTHWHGDYDNPLQSFPIYSCWIEKFEHLAKDLKREGIVVLNATRHTELTCFPQIDLENALGTSDVLNQATA